MIHLFLNPGATITSCGCSPWLVCACEPYWCFKGLYWNFRAEMWDGRTAPRDVLCSQQTLSLPLSILQLLLLTTATLPKEVFILELPKRRKKQHTQESSTNSQQLNTNKCLGIFAYLKPTLWYSCSDQASHLIKDC